MSPDPLSGGVWSGHETSHLRATVRASNNPPVSATVELPIIPLSATVELPIIPSGSSAGTQNCLAKRLSLNWLATAR